ncbi:hypothetical protein glysoja_012090 [Glycine soja]|nr:hypothetical protein glysoja_012090 [Glycine soja]
MEHASNRKLIPPSSPEISNMIGTPKSNPRIGHEYQEEVHSMIQETERLQLLMNPADSELVHNKVEDNVAAANLNNSWSDADAKSFLLGLFIFGKDFVQIKRFLENKEMGEILSFYYGKFYKSDEYRRWSDCMRIKGRKCITGGHQLFSGQKQRELLSRLTPHVSEEYIDALQMVSKSYSEGRISLEEYVSCLKSTVGLGVLVEAVGIGKGKEDLKLEVEETKVCGCNEKVVEKGSNNDGEEPGYKQHYHCYLKPKRAIGAKDPLEALSEKEALLFQANEEKENAKKRPPS